MKFAFLIHPLSRGTANAIRFDPTGQLRAVWGTQPLRAIQVLRQLQQDSRGQSHFDQNGDAPRDAADLKTLTFPGGETCRGKLIEVPLLPHEIIEQPDHAVGLMEQAVDQAVEWGAELVGLGSLTGIVGGRGTHLAERGPCAITTGNSLTTYSAVQNVFRVCDEFDLDLAKLTVAVVGVPGSIASCAAVLLAPHAGRLILAGRRVASRSTRLASELSANFSTDLDEVAAQANIILTATSSGGCIDPRKLRPGTIVVDVGVPTDVIATAAADERHDVLLLTGGLSRLPNDMPRESTFLWFHDGMIPSCLAETIVLASQGRAENFSLGRDLCPDRVQEIGGVAKDLGFEFSRLQSDGYPATGPQLTAFRKSLAGTSRALKSSPARAASRTRDQVARHLNPVLAALTESNGPVQTFVRAKGTTLVRDDGIEFLDLVGGYGALNLGHNHPRIAAAVQRAMSDDRPGFSPSAINPLAAELAERLIAISPANLEMVTFTNSGTESTEAAIKLARAATKRTALLSCHGSFHGKSMGALSLTGNQNYQQPFAPLLPDTTRINFGDIDQLERELTTQRYAAFVVEPIQAEGGVQMPPDNYLQQAQSLCQATGTLFVLDEIQTGLGRTGRMFAADLFELNPDVMLLAKSLSGGLIPIGAMLSRRDAWLSAYGSLEQFALHSSTFAGGSLACSAATETIATLADEHLATRAQQLGKRFLTGLAQQCGHLQCVKEVRGAGLLIGLEFNPLPERSLRHWHQISPDPLSRFLTTGIDQALQTMPALYCLQALLDQHRIYAQATRSQPLVVRIEPPLTIAESDVDRVITAFAQVCAEFDSVASLTDEVIGRTSVGRHDANLATS